VTAILSVSLLNAATTFGLIFTGLLVDRFHISTVLFISAIGSAMSVFLLWGLAVKEPVLYAFAIVYGVFAGGYTASWSGSAVEIRNDYPEAEVAVIMGVLAAGRGFGCMLSGPLSEGLLRIGNEPSGLGFAYGTKFRSLIIFTGITMLFGRFGLLGRFGTRARHGKTAESRSEENPLLSD
jgi:MFS family permease